LLSSYYSFETRPGGSTRDPTDPRLKPGRIEEKIGGGKTQCDPVDPVTRLTRQYMVDPTRPGQKPGCNPLTFLYY
jgi:hypothetical protein